MEVDKGKYVDLVQAEDPPSLEDVINVKERPEPASILGGAAVPKRRLYEKTALSSLPVEELQDRLRRGLEMANEEFSRLEANLSGEDGMVAHIYDLDCENEKLERTVQDLAVSCKRLEADALHVTGEDEEIFLQTRTISLNEVRKSLPLWIPSLRAEIENFDNNRAIKRIAEEQTREIMAEARKNGERAELIPGVGVFTRKAGDGRRRSRIVCCRNYMEARSLCHGR